MTVQVIALDQELYHQLREIHIQFGNIVVAAEQRARKGDFAGAVAWLNEAEDSDFIDDNTGLKAATARVKGSHAGDLRQQITDLLADIARGGTADTVANALFTRNIKGRRGDYHACPIANLIKTLPNVSRVAVVDGHAEVWEGDADEPYEVPLPIPASNFAYLYDQGVFLALVELPAVSA